MLINDCRPCRRIYDHGGYKETRSGAASHHHSNTHTHTHSTVVVHIWGRVSGHGGGDEEEEVEEYVMAEIRWRRAAIGGAVQEDVMLKLLG